MDELTAAIAGLQPDLYAGMVGFFWIVSSRTGQDAILGEMVNLTEGELYGPSVVHPGGHYKFWTRMQKRGLPWLRAKGLSAALARTEYEDWPRGRVSFSLENQRYMLFTDPRLRTPFRIAMIRKTFRLPEMSFDMRSDGHYQPVKATRLERW